MLARPVSFFYEEYGKGEMGCEVERCAREVIALGNPVIWWGADRRPILMMVWLLVSRRDWRAGGHPDRGCSGLAALVLVRRPQRSHHVLLLRSRLRTVSW